MGLTKAFIGTFSLLIHILSLQKRFDNCVKCEKLTDKVQVLESLTIDNIQVLEISTKERRNNTQTQTEEFRSEPTAHCTIKLRRGGPRLLETNLSLSS